MGSVSETAGSQHPLALLRRDRGLSRERLAQRAGVSARTVYGIEREGHEPRRATAVVLAAVLGCDPAQLTDAIAPADQTGATPDTGKQARHAG